MSCFARSMLLPPSLLMPGMVLQACHSTPPIPTETALAPALAHMDRDGDGKVTREDYLAVAYSAPPFGMADENSDEQLQARELADLLLSQDPITFDGGKGRAPVSQVLDPQVFHPGSYEERMLGDLFSFLAMEARYRDPAPPLPDAPAISRAASTATLDSPESQAVLDMLHKAYQAVDLPFPPRLIPAAPSSTPGQD